MERQQELAIALRDVLDLVDTNQLVRNPMADSEPDWMRRMVNFVMVLSRAKALVEPDPKEPAKVISITDPIFEQQKEVLQTLSEKFQEDLEPIQNHGKRYCV